MKKWIYPAIIVTISIFILVFLPMLGSSTEIKANYPTTRTGWIFWATVRVSLCMVNLLFLYCFTHQGQENASQTANYKKAMELMGKHEKEKAFRSPAKWKVEQYGKKGFSSITMTALSLFALSSAILQYDWVALITYAMSIIIGVSFGLVSMKAAERYWSEEFYFYAMKHYGGEEYVQL